MTSPFIQKRNKQALTGLPQDETLNPLEQQPAGSTLLWQQKDAERASQLQAMQKAISDRQQPLANTLGTDSFNNRLQLTKNMGTTATAGVVASVNTQRAQQQAAFAQQMSGLSAQSQAGMNADGSAITQSVGNYVGQDANLAAIARAGGFQEKDIPMAIAIMKAESGGNPRALNTSNRNGSTDTGIFQINSVHSSWTKGMDLNDPVQNAKAAFKIFSDAGGKWTPWSTFNNGAAQKKLVQPASYAPAPTAIQPYGTNTSSGIRAVAVQTAMRAEGVPYVWGGNSLSKGVDCSGLVQQVYKSLGINLPRTADEQSKSTLGSRVAVSQLKPGDLVAWQGGWRGAAYVGHIAIFKGRDAKGNAVIIEAAHRGTPVRERALRPGESAFGVALHFPGE